MDRKFSDQNVVIAAKEQVSCGLSGETVILHLKDGIYYGLNEVGTHIWGLLRAPCTVQELLDSILSEYDVDPEQCKMDLLVLLDQLSVKGLIRIEEK